MSFFTYFRLQEALILRFVFVWLFVCFTVSAAAQKLTGRITDKETGAPLYYVTVTNLVSRITVFSDEEGNYTITARPGDNISFNYMSHKALQLPAPLGVATLQMNVELQPIAYDLQETVIRPGLTKYQRDSAERKSLYQHQLSRRRASIMSPFSFVAEQFSPKARQRKRFKRNYYNWEEMSFVDSRYTPDLTFALTKLGGDTLAHFMNTYPMPYDFARAATELELKMWIRYNYREYMKEEKFNNIPHLADTLTGQSLH
ncbi:MAG: carboxypeptidase-like regulatory domain-containing protein [Flavipsychrobacter sp.]|nr:carboxypeptidase-like regulatory domain-containing protein [Flavipsychrobacter sp.]